MMKASDCMVNLLERLHFDLNNLGIQIWQAYQSKEHFTHSLFGTTANCMEWQSAPTNVDFSFDTFR